jgi:hypothetical protein
LEDTEDQYFELFEPAPSHPDLETDLPDADDDELGERLAS